MNIWKINKNHLRLKGKHPKRLGKTVSGAHTLSESVRKSFLLARMDIIIIHMTIDRVTRKFLPQQWRMIPELSTVLITSQILRKIPERIKLYISNCTVSSNEIQKQKWKYEGYFSQKPNCTCRDSNTEILNFMMTDS
jgi:hypothetical protein